MGRRVGAAAAATLMVLTVVVATRPAAETRPPPADPSASPSAVPIAELDAFVTANRPQAAPQEGRFGFVLTDPLGVVVKAEDEAVPIAILSSIRRADVSPSGRHLYWWSAEPFGVHRLHVFDTISLEPPQAVLAVTSVGKDVLRWSSDDQFVAYTSPEHPDTTRLVALASGRTIDAPTVTVRGLSIWTTTARSPFDPGTSITPLLHKFTRPDGSATTYLTFDPAGTGRWYGERVEATTGRRTPVSWNVGGNPYGAIRVGVTTGEPRRYDVAPQLEPDGTLSAARALWLAKNSVGLGPVTREAVRTVTYGEYLDSRGGGSLATPRATLVHVVVLQTVSQPMHGLMRPPPCLSAISVYRADGKGPVVGGGCSFEEWPTRLPAAFGVPHLLDWSAPRSGSAPGPQLVR